MVVKTKKYYFQHLAENSIEYLLKSNTEQGNLSGHQIFQPFNFFYIFWMCFFVLVIYESTFIHSSSAIHFRICQKLNKQKINKISWKMSFTLLFKKEVYSWWKVPVKHFKICNILYTKIQSCFFCFSFHATLFFPPNEYALVYVNITLAFIRGK